MKVMTNNLNGSNHKLSGRTFNERANLTFALYNNRLPDIWALQEIPTGGNKQSCLCHLRRLSRQHGYRMILPEPAWKTSEHPKSIQSVLLLRDVKRVDVLKLDEKNELPNRYNYVRVTFNQYPDKAYYILNIHAPQTEYFPGHSFRDRYVRLRMYLADQFYDVLKDEMKKLLAAGKNVIVLGDFNRTLDDETIKEILDLGLIVASEVKDNTYFCTGNTNRSVDHILISRNMTGKVENCSVDRNFVKLQKLSDHATVSLDINLTDFFDGKVYEEIVESQLEKAN